MLPTLGDPRFMRRTLVIFAFGSLLPASALQAQEQKVDSAMIARAHQPILRTGELLGVLGATALGVALDQVLRNNIRDSTDPAGWTISDIGNTYGSRLVYPALLVLAVGGKALGSKGLYGVSSRALKSIVVAGVAAMTLKVVVGRERPVTSPDNRLVFHPFRFKDNSFPSGHTTLAFALATSLSRETRGRWDDAAFFALASLTAYARMHDDKHWFSDVVFGAGMGILSARFVHRREARLLVGANVLGASLAF